MSKNPSTPGSAAPDTSAGRPKNAYRKTLNLPTTRFPMKANLVQNEPASLKRWDALGLYERVRRARAGAEPFVFHDGPPYANGSIHLGHLMNKCLKDFVVRSQTMLGKDCPFVPGWDCHGLPIEHKVMTELVASGKIDKLKDLDEDARRLAIRRACQKDAGKFHELQSSQMQRLMTLADYAHPYLTMTPDYEAAVLEVLAGMVGQGLVTRALKPVHWSIANETALAEAELEYADREDTSVYVDFEAADAAAVYGAFGIDEDEREERDLGQTPSLMIWTTTPWTLPANLAIAVNERFVYALVRVDGNVCVLAEDRVEAVTKAGGSEDVQVLATAKGSALVGLGYRHPLRAEKPTLDGDQSKVWTVVAAEYVTLEDGTGLVHTAPGHGADDYQTGVREGIGVYCPVQGDGTYDATVPDWLVGKSVWEANDLVTDRLGTSGHLFFSHSFTHSYPHDWRSKTPVIFRATEQWFIGVDTPMARDGRTLRAAALEAIEGVEFLPAWGRSRLRGMLESRPDWCISRQRAWGLPIPAFFDAAGRVLMTAASVRAVGDVVRAKGSDAWYTQPAGVLLRAYDAATDPDAPEWAKGLDLDTLTKGRDILDVWFESGSSWHAVMQQRSEGKAFPVELYLEGSDQHRGWFQTSLLPSLAVMGQPPYKTVLTHGFMVDRDGHKLSKSKGHTIEDLFKQHGADVLRWWVCSLSYQGDVKVDESFFGIAGESYRKVRNTLRFMLSNLGDYEDAGAGLGDLPGSSIDAWAAAAYDTMAARVGGAYARYDFRSVHGLIYEFCNDTLSSVYLAAVKDRLYCDRADSARRRRTQRVLWAITDGLARLLAPVMCHTADEAYRALRGVDPKDAQTCVHVETFAPATGVRADEGWDAVFAMRERALLALEQAKERGIDNPLDAGLVVPDAQGVLAGFDRVDLADLLGVSRFELGSGDAIEVVDLRDEPRCERSWKRDGTVRERGDGGMLSDRDAQAIGAV